MKNPDHKGRKNPPISPDPPPARPAMAQFIAAQHRHEPAHQASRRKQRVGKKKQPQTMGPITPVTRHLLAQIASEGFTPIPHYLMDELLFGGLPAGAIKIMLTTARYTFGEGQRSAPLSIKDFTRMPPIADARGIDAIPASFLQPLEAAGYTPIPHYTMIRLLALKSVPALRLALYIARHTWGENKHAEGMRIRATDILHLSPASFEKATEELLTLGLLAVTTERLANYQISVLCRLRLEEDIENRTNIADLSALEEVLQELEKRGGQDA